MVDNMIHDKTWGVLYKPRRRFPPNRLVLPPSSSPPPLLIASVPNAPRRSSLTRSAAPPRHARSAVSYRQRARPRRCPPSQSPTRISVPDAMTLPDAAALLDSPPPRPWSLGGDRVSALLLDSDPRPSSSVAASCSRYVALPPPTPPLASPPLRPPPACVCPMTGQRAGGFALQMSAREMLASASIFN
jgi:hypothetical protein